MEVRWLSLWLDDFQDNSGKPHKPQAWALSFGPEHWLNNTSYCLECISLYGFTDFTFGIEFNMLFCSPSRRLQVSVLGCTEGVDQRAPHTFVCHGISPPGTDMKSHRLTMGKRSKQWKFYFCYTTATGIKCTSKVWTIAMSFCCDAPWKTLQKPTQFALFKANCSFIEFLY